MKNEWQRITVFELIGNKVLLKDNAAPEFEETVVLISKFLLYSLAHVATATL